MMSKVDPFPANAQRWAWNPALDSSYPISSKNGPGDHPYILKL